MLKVGPNLMKQERQISGARVCPNVPDTLGVIEGTHTEVGAHNASYNITERGVVTVHDKNLILEILWRGRLVE